MVTQATQLIMPMASSVPVLIAGGGPVGLVAAYTLAHHGIRCVLIERNETTTKWPKMDITNVRSMEILRGLGLADELREQGVGQDFSFDVIISTGLGGKCEDITRWKLQSPNEWRKIIKQQNDGSMPREPYQRCSQAIFEAWLKVKIEANELIESHWSTKLVDVQEEAGKVFATVQEGATGSTRTIEAQYLIGCDGGGSITRKKMGLGLTGGPLPLAMGLVHFKSRDLTRLHKQGQFWHIFFTHGGVIISQDEIDTWTVHLPVPLDFDIKTLDPEKHIFQVLGGQGDSYEIDVDEILVSSSWRPNNAIADRYRSDGGRVFIAGDACHQNIPTGGYGMNTGLADAYDISWKLAMVLKGAGGEDLLESYEVERRPVAIRNVQRAAEHMSVHQGYAQKAMEAGSEVMLSNSEEAQAIKALTKEHVETNDGENKDHGIELDYRLRPSPVIPVEVGVKEPEWTRQAYAPSTIPGSRAPHVFLKDGSTSIFDLLSKDYTVVDFSQEGSISLQLEKLARQGGFPLARVHLPNEEHVRKVWERDVVLVRPDYYVGWRSDSKENYDDQQLDDVLSKVFGKDSSGKAKREHINGDHIVFAGAQRSFNQDEEKVEKLAEFQR
ncbi:monooxygenase [Rhizodiscina lignyota]|uniref:Monooxygenase n=1 Tax=Rhizodiscina lignyota TaxID=1504668 RepID=A0A9P4IK55_9PEZI|nr:monooxygenase [Rhizodiscina lignyota]